MDIVRIIEVTVSVFFDKRVKKLKDRFLKEEINRIVRDMQSGLNPGGYIKDKPYPSKYKFPHLYEDRIGANNYWRLIYTIIGSQNKRIYHLVDFIDHDEYDRLFHYKQS